MARFLTFHLSRHHLLEISALSKQYWEDLSNLSVMIVVMNMEQIGSLILYLSTYTSLVNIIYFL